MPSIPWDDIFENAEQDEKPPAAGPYLAEIEKAEWTTSSTGKDMLKLRARIVGGPEKDKALFTQIVISPENSFAVKIAVRHLTAIGLTRADLNNLSNAEQEEKVTGTVVLMETEIDTKYDPSNPRSQVKDIKPAPAGTVSSSKSSADAPPPRAPAVSAPPPSNAPPSAPFED